MRAQELPVLAARLSELAEYYDKRAPGTSALKVWHDALSECQTDDVLFVLSDWPKTHRQMPLADEVLKLCRSRVSDRVEAQAEENRRTAGTIAEMVEGLSKNLSPEAEKARREIAEWLASAGSKMRDHKAWAKKLKAREEAGEQLSDVQRRSWREALRHNEEVA